MHKTLTQSFSAICSYQNKLCGLCGNYDGDTKDDFRKPDGSLAENANDFGHSWNMNPEWVLQRCKCKETFTIDKRQMFLRWWSVLTDVIRNPTLRSLGAMKKNRNCMKALDIVAFCWTKMDLLLCAIPKSTPMYVHVEDSAHIINKCGTSPYSELVVFVYVCVHSGWKCDIRNSGIIWICGFRWSHNIKHCNKVIVCSQNYFRDCVFDLCELDGAKPILCEAIEAYVNECQDRGVNLGPWRNETFCREYWKDKWFNLVVKYL